MNNEDKRTMLTDAYRRGANLSPRDFETMDPRPVFESPINAWFELSYAQFLTIPRLVMESMPHEWQTKMAALLQEMDDTFDWRPHEGRYWVKLKDSNGKYMDAPLNDYRRGSCEHLRRNSK